MSCVSGRLTSNCKLSVAKGESVPKIGLEGDVEGPVSKPLVFHVPYTGMKSLYVCILNSFVVHSTFVTVIEFFSAVNGSRQSQVEGKLFKDGKLLQLKDVEVVVLDDRIDFKYKKPARELSGKYQLKVSNAQGEDTRDIKINFQGRYEYD